MRDIIYSFLLTTFAIILVAPINVIGQVRESNNYKIERDSLNIGGGFGTSDNFKLQSTVGEVGTGYSESSNYAVLAGFQQSIEESFISISSPVDLNMGSINGLTGGNAAAAAEWLVTTNNNAGYSLSIKSDTSPALKSSLDYFDDYTTDTSDPDYEFAIDYTASEFGYNPFSVDVVNKFKNNGSSCNVGSGITAYKCWNSLNTSGEIVVQGTSSNDPSGATTTINFRAESGNNKILTAGSYAATITMTAIAL